MSYSSEVNKLLADGSRAYSSKNYELASEKYGEACEKYSDEKGDEDADLLFLYGKSLFQNAVLKSEVFGGQPGDDEQEEDDKEEENEENKEDGDKFQFFDVAPVAEEEGEDGAPQDEEEEADEENAGEVDQEEQEESNGKEKHDKENEEEQSDFELAWEMFDITRNLLEAKLQDIEEQGKDLTVPYLKTDDEETDNQYIILTKKLSETYDLLGEVSLESENFPQSAQDLKSSLQLRLKLYNPETSALISESHYKLSLALEFCVEDPTLRQSAVEHMKLAIDSVKKRNESETDALKKKENEELIQDLDARYQELKRDPTEELKSEQLDIIKGILGEPTADGAGSSGSAAALVNDLSGIVKKKKVAQVNDLSAVVKKRKAPGKISGSEKKPRAK